MMHGYITSRVAGLLLVVVLLAGSACLGDSCASHTECLDGEYCTDLNTCEDDLECSDYDNAIDGTCPTPATPAPQTNSSEGTMEWCIDYGPSGECRQCQEPEA